MTDLQKYHVLISFVPFFLREPSFHSKPSADAYQIDSKVLLDTVPSQRYSGSYALLVHFGVKIRRVSTATQ